MMKRTLLVSIYVFVSVLIFPGISVAMDIGDPLFTSDMGGKIVKADIFYEKFKRTIKYKEENFSFLFKPPFTPDEIKSSESGRTKNEQMAGYFARINIMPFKSFSFQLDGGYVKNKEDKARQMVFGGGLKVSLSETAIEKNVIRLCVLANGFYVPKFTSYSSSTNPDYGFMEMTNRTTYYGITAGLALADNMNIDENNSLITYIGMFYSILRGRSYSDASFPSNPNVSLSYSGKFIEKSPYVAVVGLSWLTGKNMTFRIEGHFIGDSSISGGIGYAF